MTEKEFQEERRKDDAWTTPRLLVLTGITLTTALSIILFFASRAAPY